MDSPESSKPSTITTAAVESVPAQESPVFSYISNLSPIQPFKAPPAIQGFPGLNSPPLVFTSPRLKPNCRTTYLKRTKFPELSTSKLSGQDEDCKNSVTFVDGSGKLDIQLSTGLVTCTEKAIDSNSPVNDQTESPTGHPDQFLADVLNMDSVDPNASSNSASEKSECIDQPPDDVTGKKFVVKLDYKHNTRISEEMETVANPAISWSTQEVHKQDTSVDASKVETDKKQGDIISDDQSPETGLESSVDHGPTNQDHVDSMTENVEAGQIGPLGHFSHVLSRSEQIDKGNKNVVETTEEVLTEPVLKKVQQCDPEAFQHRGMRRRCLQFDGEGPKSLSLETPSTPMIGKPPDTIQHISYPKESLNSTTNIPKPSKIGLHLNSLFNPLHAGSGATIHLKQARRGSFSIQGKKSMTVMNSANDCVSASTDNNRHDTGSNLQSSLSTYIIKPSNNSTVLNAIEDQLTPGNKRNCDTENDEDAEELYKLSPKKKRKKTSESSGGDGCKRCNCKKSKCLKLYCDCFAAGIYCAEPCTCQGCFNRPEYEDTVLETRQQIESRNPLAFAPKVVRHIIEPPASSCGEEGVHFTPSSARHKRGCNCKKSLCLKKYCECYQANVGCSDGCRCEGCKNVYGQKGEYGMIKEVLSDEDTNERTNASFVNNSQMVASGNVVCHTELRDPHNLTPVTPAFQNPNHEKDASKAWSHSGKYLQSPESGLPFVAPYVISPGSPRNSDNNDSVSETTKEILDLVSFNQDSDYGNADAADEFSAVCREPGNLGLLSGLPNSKEWSNNSVAQSSSGNRLCSSASFLRWRSSPLTPMAQFSGTKLHQGVDFDHELLNDMQDDTPELLKDAATPDAVKVSSPNKKRVSPPHGPVHEFGSSSPGGLRSGFKFILKSVPSFPPLTPCIDSKSGTVQQTNDPQHCSGTVNDQNR